MKSIEPQLPGELASVIDPHAVPSSPAFPVRTYRRLVSLVASLSYRNPGQVLFFRGQGQDYTVGDDTSSIYPSIYRSEYLPKAELRYRFEVLEEAGRQLLSLLKKQEIEGVSDVARRKYVRWAILQHYEVCATPLIDITHSIHVACSFAQREATDGDAYVYAFGIPQLTHRITIDSEADLVTVRLLSICPPEALRPYFQEGYLTGTPDLEQEYDDKTELDLRNRLLMKFRIPRGARFWGRGFNAIPDTVLLPERDRFKGLCSRIRVKLPYGVRPGEVGDFLAEWTQLESMILDAARDLRARTPSFGRVVQALQEVGRLSSNHASALKYLSKIRNSIVHRPGSVDSETVIDSMRRAAELRDQIYPIQHGGKK